MPTDRVHLKPFRDGQTPHHQFTPCLLSSTSRLLADSLAVLCPEPEAKFMSVSTFPCHQDSSQSAVFLTPINPWLAPIYHSHGDRNHGNVGNWLAVLHLGLSHLWTTPCGVSACSNPGNQLIPTIGQPHTVFHLCTKSLSQAIDKQSSNSWQNFPTWLEFWSFN